MNYSYGNESSNRVDLKIGNIRSSLPNTGLLSRYVQEKPKHTLLQPWQNRERIVVKFRENSAVALIGGQLQSAAGLNLIRLNNVLSRHSITQKQLQRYFDQPTSQLSQMKLQGEARSKRELANLNLYYSLTLKSNIDAAQVCDDLNALDIIEFAEPEPLPAPLPIDLSPVTPDFSDRQSYLDSAPVGISAMSSRRVPGVRGDGMQIVDIEYDWVLDHEDLELPPSANIDSATLSNPFPENEANHGTAVLGQLIGGDNGYGITGIVPQSSALVIPAITEEFGYNVGRAINLAASHLNPGDVILIEQQTTVCDQAYGPVEWFTPWFDAISTATANGIVVIMAAGNGQVNLDDPSCQSRFDTSVRDSGAIIVGAGHKDTRARLSFSSYGSRVNLQGWGRLVATTGYGNLFNPGDIRQRYTRLFSGTSSASPIVAGAALAVQGSLKAANAPLLTSMQMRQLLMATGTAQSGNDHIGPLPNINSALLTFDRDGDELLDSLELSLGTDPDAADSDGDGILDYDELNRDGDPTNYTAGVDSDPGANPTTGIDPNVADPRDTDGDGLLDNEDANPAVSDSSPIFSRSIDIGVAGQNGSFNYDATDNAYTIETSAFDLGGSADQVFYIYETISGDFDLQARIASISNHYAKAGLMVRNSLEPSDSQLSIAIERSTGGLQIHRTEELGNTHYLASSLAMAEGHWVRLEKIANTLRSYGSSDGVNWTLVGSETMAMDSDFYLGIVAVNSETSTRTTIVVDEVKRSNDTTANTAPTISIGEPVDNSQFILGDNVTFSAVAHDQQEGDLSAAITWQSDIDGELGNASSINITSLSLGVHLITASVQDSGNLIATDTVSITINNPVNTQPLINITAPTDSIVFSEGDMINFIASAIDNEDGDISSNITWSSDIDNAIGSGSNVSTDTLSVGLHTITATVADSENLINTATIQISVEPQGSSSPVVFDHSIDIGITNLAGGLSYDSNTGVYNLTSSGFDVGGVSDNFFFAYTQRSGDIDIRARITYIDSFYAKTGLMIRSSLDSNSMHAAMTLEHLSGGVSIYRDNIDASTIYHSLSTNITLGAWVRLQKVGDTINRYASENGVNWTLVASSTLTIGDNYFIGICAVSNESGGITNSTVENLTIE